MQIKKLFISLIVVTSCLAGAISQEIDEKPFGSIPEGNYELRPDFEDADIDLTGEDFLPLEKLAGHTYKRKDKDEKVKQIYSFKKDGTYSFVTEIFAFKMIVSGKYEADGYELTFYPEEHDAKFLGFKVENKNIEVKESAYEPIKFDCWLVKKGVMIGDEFFRKR